MNRTKWISGQKSLGEGDFHGSLYIRKTYTVNALPQKAILQICGLGYATCFANGKNVTEDLLTTPFTAFDKRVIYNEYDISDKIVVGENALGVFLGNGWYNDDATLWDFKQASWRHIPKLAAKMILYYADGTTTEVRTDSTWKVTAAPCTFNHIRQGEIYDARLEIKGWNLPDCDCTSWENAKVVRAPGGVLQTTDMPPIRVIRTLKPVGITEKGYYDFGENISGRIKIKVRGEAGRKVIMRYEERLAEDGSFCNVANLFTRLQEHPLHHENQYILKGDGVEEYAPSFSYYGFRYVEVENAPEDFEIVAEVMHTDLPQIGSFTCSDPMLNKIHEASIRSILTNYVGIPTDCPHREQNGWTGDACLSCEQTLMNFDMGTSYKKWLNDFKDVQRPSGQIPGIIPTASWGYNWGSGPAWDVAMLLIPWYYYENTGDSSLIAQMWENNEKYYQYISLMSEDYITEFGLSDWCPPPKCRKCPGEITDTAYFYVFAKTMAQCADFFGYDNAFYLAEAEKIKQAWRKKFLNRTDLYQSQTYLACAVYQGLLLPEEKPFYVNKLAEAVIQNDYHIDCGILGTKYIFSVLAEAGYSELLYKMVTNPTMPSYAYWINQGMTTLCEHWDMVASCNHHMYSEVEHWFYKYLAGIRITHNTVCIQPCFIPQVEKVSAVHRGISVSYDAEKLTVTTDRAATVVLENETYSVEKGTHTYLLQREVLL